MSSTVPDEYLTDEQVTFFETEVSIGDHLLTDDGHYGSLLLKCSDRWIVFSCGQTEPWFAERISHIRHVMKTKTDDKRSDQNVR